MREVGKRAGERVRQRAARTCREGGACGSSGGRCTCRCEHASHRRATQLLPGAPPWHPPSRHRALDGVLDVLNSKNMTDAGPLQLIDEDKVRT